MLKELRRKRAALIDKCVAMNDTAVKEGRGLSETEQKEYDELYAQAEGLGETIKRSEALAKELTGNDDTETRSVKTNVERGNNIETKELGVEKPWDSFGEQLRAVADAARNPMGCDMRLFNGLSTRDARGVRASGMSEGVLADGGFLVGTDYSSSMIERMHQTGQLPSYCSRMPISGGSNGIKIPTVDETSRTDGNRYGGIQVYTAAEAATVTATKPRFGELSFELIKYMGLCYMTDELLQDTSALESWVMGKFPEEMAFRVSNDIVHGTGAGQLLGLLNSGALISVAKETGQVAATVVFENIINMYTRLDPRSIPTSKWFINQEVWKQIFQLSAAVGTGGSLLFIEPGKLPEAPMGALLGRPIEVTEHAQGLGTVGDIMLLDMSKYMIVDKGGVDSAVSMHVRFIYDEMAYRFTYRVDGKPIYQSALTPARGTDTVSPFVALATRA